MTVPSQSLVLRAVLVDDEPLARENLQMLLEEFCPGVEVVGQADGVEMAHDLIVQQGPDVVFLDIRMPSGSEGFQLLDALPNRHFQVVFVTAFKDYAIRALNASAAHYLLKPIDIEDLQVAVLKVRDMHAALSDSAEGQSQYAASIAELRSAIRNQRAPARLTLYHNRGFRIVPLPEITRLEAADSYTRFFFTDGSDYLDTKTMRVYEELLLDQGFLRVHKSHLINLAHLIGYDSQDGHLALLTGGVRVPVARARLSAFMLAVRDL